jgi:two-component system, OmpR family, phosphate regulon sensor histidine kinase PhoR
MNPKVQDAIRRLTTTMASKPLREYQDLVCVEACALTQSTLSYFATMNPAEDVLTMIGWSKTAMANCGIMDKPIVYKLEDTGLWGDAVRERNAVITNDYKSLVKPTKKGYPDGHVNVRRHMNLPVFENRKVALVVGVGNKPTDYTTEDAQNLTDLMNEVWKTLKTKL